MKHIEVQKLVEWGRRFKCHIRLNGASRNHLIPVDFLILGEHYKLYIDDEYKDFDETNQSLCLYLVLRSLIDYKAEVDFLKWCNLYALNASEHHWLSYYRSLGEIIGEIERKTGELRVFIADLDYQLRSGAFYELTNLQQ